IDKAQGLVRSADRTGCGYPGIRIDCGYPGIGSEECHSRGCCFNSSIPGDKWCFYPNDYSKIISYALISINI
ncbi:unnamed protein product, partial [Staurois parvus]